jgi:hypothetical protein
VARTSRLSSRRPSQLTPGEEIHVVLDDLSTHTAPEVKA